MTKVITDLTLPNMKLHEWIHKYRLAADLITEEEKFEIKRQLLEEIEKYEMLPFYKFICEQFSWAENQDLIEKLSLANAEELEKLENSLIDAKENLGKVEVQSCLLTKAHFLCRIGDLTGAIAAYDTARHETVYPGSHIDILLTLIRIGFLFDKPSIIKLYLEPAKTECEANGDWERKNKLKIYEAIYLTQQRHFHQAAELLCSSVAVFTATELISFETFIFITVIVAMTAFERPALKSKIIECAELVQVLEEQYTLKKFLEALYYCQYNEFMQALVDISPYIQKNPYLLNHSRYIVRSIRLKAYKQFLEPYESVITSSMADAFCVSEQFLEEDVADFIANGKLNCKIDCVKKVIICTKQISSDACYMEAIKEGDLLLSRIQKLSKIIDM